jgi:hypothetical protein
MMLATSEYRVCRLAQSMGLRLVRTTDEAEQPLYRLVVPHSMTPILPGGGLGGAQLGDLEDWLQRPWE